MKRIAITQRLDINNETGEIRDALDIRWAKLFEKLNLLPIVLPTDYSPSRIFDNFKIDGIILSGGNDLARFDKKDLSKKRDKFEKAVIKYAISRKIPIIGICHGMEIIADHFNANFKRVGNHVKIRHKIIPSEKSRYYQYLKNLKEVNSYHQYAVESISSDFIISATSDDGTIEAFEHKKYKLWGQMWHPEREKIINPQQLKIIENILNLK